MNFDDKLDAFIGACRRGVLKAPSPPKPPQKPFVRWPCAWCGGAKTTKYTKCCSLKCSRAMYLDRLPSEKVDCIQCGNAFERKNPSRIICSRRCERRRFYERRGNIYAYKRARTSYTLPPRSCVECGASFIPRRSLTVTCGEPCYLARNARVTREWHAARRKKAKP